MSMLFFKPIRELSCLPARPKWLLFLIGDNANDNGLAWPGVETLERDSGMHKRTVQKFLRTFENDRVLLPHDNAAGGRGKIKGWKIDLARARELYGEGGRGFGQGDDEAEKDGVAAPFEIVDADEKGGATNIKGGLTCNPPTPP